MVKEHTRRPGGITAMGGHAFCLTPFSMKVAFGAPGIAMREEGVKKVPFLPQLKPPRDESWRNRLQITSVQSLAVGKHQTFLSFWGHQKGHGTCLRCP
jgi:hypothetical protein